MHPLSLIFITFIGFQPGVRGAQVIAPSALAQQYGMTTSTTFPFPKATASSSDSQVAIADNWGLGKGRFQDNPDNIAFVADPYPDSVATASTGPLTSTGPVLQVTYPAKSFSHDTGGTQFYNLWNTTDGSNFLSMIVSYELAFEDGFDWVKGGKLPGLRGGLNSTGCSGGNQPSGDCFSARLMWRKSANGEVYAYIPTTNDVCKRKGVICNSDFGTSFNRGSFGFVTGRWNRVTMLVQLNNPPNVANGQIQLFYNDEMVVDAEGLQIRSTDRTTVNGLYFSTFFGGSDSSWATPNTVHTYFRNIQLWGSENASALTGPTIKSSSVSHHALSTTVSCILVSLVFGILASLA